MTDDEQARQNRADELRRRLRELTGPDEREDVAAENGTPEMLPGESPNSYVQRRMREIDHKPRPPHTSE
jgi:hypothetical protein